MAKKCVKVAASKRAKSHIRCFAGAKEDTGDGKEKEKKATGGGGDSTKNNNDALFNNKPSNFDEVYNEAVKKGYLPAGVSYAEVMQGMGYHTDFGEFTSEFRINDEKGYEGLEVRYKTKDMQMKSLYRKDDIYLATLRATDPPPNWPDKNRGVKLMRNVLGFNKQFGKQSVELVGATELDGYAANGYYTWPRMGFETKNKSMLKTFLDFPGSTMKGKNSLLDIMSTQEGRNFWKKEGRYAGYVPNGYEMLEMTFPLKNGKHLDMFNAYYKDHH